MYTDTCHRLEQMSEIIQQEVSEWRCCAISTYNRFAQLAAFPPITYQRLLVVSTVSWWMSFLSSCLTVGTDSSETAKQWGRWPSTFCKPILVPNLFDGQAESTVFFLQISGAARGVNDHHCCRLSFCLVMLPDSLHYQFYVFLWCSTPISLVEG